MNKFYSIKPLNNLFFRSGKPFGGIDELVGEAIDFPPSPSNFYGAIRSVLFRVEDLPLEDTIFEIKQILFFYKETSEVYLPLPSVLLAKKEDLEKAEENIEFIKTSLIPNVNLTNSSTPYLFVSPSLEYDSFKGVISIDNFVEFLKGEEKIIENPFVFNKAIKLTRKTGIKRLDDTHNVEDGKLFIFEGLDIDNLEFIIELDIDFTGNIVKLGAENKISVVKPLDESYEVKTGLVTDVLLIYFATPTILKEDTTLLDLLGLEGDLLSYSIPKLRHIGGFDIVSGTPKPMYKFIPEGSVFVFKLKKAVEVDKYQGIKLIDKTIEGEFLNMFPHQAPLSKQGFGIAYFGTYKF